MDRKKKNILIGGLIAIVLVMAVGYAAFATSINITGTSNIDSRWDVHIKTVGETANSATEATNVNAQRDSNLMASFACNLTTPGISTISYDIVVENTGTFGAKLSSITLTGQTDYINATDTVSIDNTADALSWTEDPTTLNKNYYLDHDVEGDKVIANYVCFILNNTQYCLKGTNDGSAWEQNKALLTRLKTAGTITCPKWFDTYAECSGSGLGYLNTSSDGPAYAGASNTVNCDAGFWDESECVEE